MNILAFLLLCAAVIFNMKSRSALYWNLNWKIKRMVEMDDGVRRENVDIWRKEIDKQIPACLCGFVMENSLNF